MTSIEWLKFPVKTDIVIMYDWGEEIPVKDGIQKREEYNINIKFNIIKIYLKDLLENNIIIGIKYIIKNFN